MIYNKQRGQYKSQQYKRLNYNNKKSLLFTSVRRSEIFRRWFSEIDCVFRRDPELVIGSTLFNIKTVQKVIVCLENSEVLNIHC